MGKNSVFDDIGIGASDLGLAKDPDEVAKENKAALVAQTAAAEKAKSDADAEAAAKEDDARRKGNKASTVLTGSKGLTTEENISRRTLLGS